MTGDTSKLTVPEPERYARQAGIQIETGTFDHPDSDHCERNKAGRAIVGVTDDAGELLAMTDREEEVLVPPNDTVTPGEDWAAVAREWVEGMTGSVVTLDGVERVREMEHIVDGEVYDRTYHVLFAASIADTTVVDGLCETNPFTLDWYDSVPEWFDTEQVGTVADDLRVFLDE